MKNRVLLALAAAAILSASVQDASATPTNDTTNGVTSGKVTGLGPGPSTHTEVYPSTQPGACTAVMRISRSHPSHDVLYRGLMSAHLSGKSVDILYENISGTCWVKHVMVWN
jgi:hypothetical protein